MAPEMLTLNSISGSCDGNITMELSPNLSKGALKQIKEAMEMNKYYKYFPDWYHEPSEEYEEIERYIINENATILFWDDGEKTVSKRHKEDKFDKELGFLFAYFYKKYDGTKASRKRVINCIDYKKIKQFLFEFYVNDSGKTPDQARKYLSGLIVDKK